MLYISIISLLVCLIYHFDYQKHTTYRLSWYIFCGIIFVIVAGLRYRLGIDSTRYDYKFSASPSLMELFSYNYGETRYAPCYIFLNAIARSCSDSFVMMQFLHAIFINSFIFYFFYKNTKHVFFSLFLYFILIYFNYNFEVLRESCAIAIFLFSWKYFKSNDWIKYYICCIIAILFHPSALFLLIFPIFYIPVFRKFFCMGWTFGITVIIVFIISGIVSVKFFDLIRLINIASVDNYAEMYENSSLAESKNLNLIGKATFFIKNLLYPFVAIILLKGSHRFGIRMEIKSDEKYKLEYFLCWFVYISIATVFIKLFYRFNNYLIPFWIIILADVVFSKIHFKRNKHIVLSFGLWWMVLLPYIAINLYGYFSEDTGSNIPLIKRYYPYSSVLNPEKDPKREELYRYLGGD